MATIPSGSVGAPATGLNNAPQAANPQPTAPDQGSINIPNGPGYGAADSLSTGLGSAPQPMTPSQASTAPPQVQTPDEFSQGEMDYRRSIESSKSLMTMANILAMTGNNTFAQPLLNMAQLMVKQDPLAASKEGLDFLTKLKAAGINPRAFASVMTRSGVFPKGTYSPIPQDVTVTNQDQTLDQYGQRRTTKFIRHINPDTGLTAVDEQGNPIPDTPTDTGYTSETVKTQNKDFKNGNISELVINPQGGVINTIPIGKEETFAQRKELALVSRSTININTRDKERLKNYRTHISDLRAAQTRIVKWNTDAVTRTLPLPDNVIQDVKYANEAMFDDPVYAEKARKEYPSGRVPMNDPMWKALVGTYGTAEAALNKLSDMGLTLAK